MKQWDVIYQYCDTPACQDHGTWVITPKPLWRALTDTYALSLRQIAGFTLLALGLGGILGPLIPGLRLEAGYALSRALSQLTTHNSQLASLPPSAPVVFEPLTTPDGASIAPVNEEFALIVPKVGINAPIVANVDPAKPDEYAEALKTGVAHASTSFFPNEDGTVYLFSHSTNYDWFVRDLNAVFYLLKNLDTGDVVVLIYKGKRYTYKISEKKVVSPKATGYIVPYAGHRGLILQTCWPPGSISERLLIFADLVEERSQAI